MSGLFRRIARIVVGARTATGASNPVLGQETATGTHEDQQHDVQSQGHQQAHRHQVSSGDQRRRYEEQPYEEQPYEPPLVEAPPADTLAQLRKLGELKAQGVLTQAEFDQQKQRILTWPGSDGLTRGR